MKHILFEIVSLAVLVALLFTIKVSAAAEGLISDFDYRAGDAAPEYILLSTDDATMSVGTECNWKRHWGIDKAQVAENIAQNLYANACAYQPEISDSAVYEFHVDEDAVFAFLKNSDYVVKGSEAEFAVIAFGSQEGATVDVAIYPQGSEQAIAAGTFSIEDFSGSVPLSKEVLDRFPTGSYTFVATGSDFTYSFDFPVVDEAGAQAIEEALKAERAALTENLAADNAVSGINVSSSLDNGMDHAASIVLEDGTGLTVGYSPSGWDGAYMGSVTKDGSTYSGGYDDGTGVITIGLPDTAVNVNVNSGWISFGEPAEVNAGEAGLNAAMGGHESANLPLSTITSLFAVFGS